MRTQSLNLERKERTADMEHHTRGSTGWDVSAVSFGAWAIGSSWGSVNDSESLQALETAIEHGVNFFNPADIYNEYIRESVHHRW